MTRLWSAIINPCVSEMPNACPDHITPSPLGTYGIRVIIQGSATWHLRHQNNAPNPSKTRGHRVKKEPQSTTGLQGIPQAHLSTAGRPAGLDRGTLSGGRGGLNALLYDVFDPLSYPTSELCIDTKGVWLRHRRRVRTLPARVPSSPSLLLVFTAQILLTELAIYLVFFFFFFLPSFLWLFSVPALYPTDRRPGLAACPGRPPCPPPSFLRASLSSSRSVFCTTAAPFSVSSSAQEAQTADF